MWRKRFRWGRYFFGGKFWENAFCWNKFFGNNIFLLKGDASFKEGILVWAQNCLNGKIYWADTVRETSSRAGRFCCWMPHLDDSALCREVSVLMVFAQVSPLFHLRTLHALTLTWLGCTLAEWLDVVFRCAWCAKWQHHDSG